MDGTCMPVEDNRDYKEEYRKRIRRMYQKICAQSACTGRGCFFQKIFLYRICQRNIGSIWADRKPYYGYFKQDQEKTEKVSDEGGIEEVHRWYNGGWSSEYNGALFYAEEYGLIEFIDIEEEK